MRRCTSRLSVPCSVGRPTTSAAGSDDLEYQRILSDNKFAGANVALGVLLFDRNDLEGATAYFQHALELRPSAWIASYKMGEIAYRRGDLVQAEKRARQAKQSENESTLMDQLLLEIHMKQKNYPAAIQDIDAYLENDPLSENADHMRELQDKLKSQIEK